ncbi:MAG: hypothetical protein RI906_135 [Pseudomonadota bacterium]|jgi:mono/diheme cytochrome c family protein
MKQLRLCSVGVFLMSSVASAAFAQAMNIDQGRAEFMNNCSACHGESGTGDGHFRIFLNRKPADLTVLARENGGVFPAQRVFDSIDGRRTVAGHGQAGEMPVWGTSYVAQARHDPTVPPGSGEAFARARISLLIDYLNRIQAKP